MQKKQTRAEVFKTLGTNPRYIQLNKSKDEVNRALSHAKAARSTSAASLETSFNRIMREITKLEDAALKRAGY